MVVPAEEYSDSPEPELRVDPLIDPQLPSLAPYLRVLPETWITIGDLFTATLTLENLAPYAATNLMVTLPIPPSVAVVAATGAIDDATTLRWALGTLEAQGMTTVTAQFQLREIPVGEAVVLRARIMADGLPLPVGVTGGALVTTATTTGRLPERPTAEAPVEVLPTTTAVATDAPAEQAPLPELPTAEVPVEVLPTATAVATDPPAEQAPLPEQPTADAPAEVPDQTTTTVPVPVTGTTASDDAVLQSRPTEPPGQAQQGRTRFVPGQNGMVRGRDNHVTVHIPAQAYGEPLTLEYLSRAEVQPRLQMRGQVAPPEIAGFKRGFGAFFLEATDDSGRDIHQFTAPVTITVRFTPQQLEVLNIPAEDLTLFWFDESAPGLQTVDTESQGAWVPLPTMVDITAGTATVQVDHFSGFLLSDGSSPSAAYLPSLQGWQVGHVTGATSFSYPIDVPAGPNGMRPQLALTYSSAATDGAGGMRKTAQSSWVGKGWSLDTGFVALNKVEVSGATKIHYYALSFNGRSYNLVRGAAKVPSPHNDIPIHWHWHPVDESFMRIEVVQNGLSAPGSLGAPGIGAVDYGQLKPRYAWIVTDRDGTRYEFAEDVWWGWANCTSVGAFADFESNRWLLKKVIDTQNNHIDYTYARDNEFVNDCPGTGQAGTVDKDIWPTSITWGGGRYQVAFDSIARANDTQYDMPAFALRPTRETRQLQQIRVLSKQADTWEVVRAYRFDYNYSLYSDERVCDITCLDTSGWGPATGYPKLTLTGIQRLANDASTANPTALPKTTFTYHTTSGVSKLAPGGWNRLTGMHNNQGGIVTFAYAHLAHLVTPNDYFRNRHRVTTQTQTDGQGNTSTWSYAYSTPLVNTVGTMHGDTLANSTFPTSAKLYYTTFWDGNSHNHWLVHRPGQEFQGHATVTETGPTGAKTRYTFIQPSSGCTPAPAAKYSHAAITSDPCFQTIQRRELLLGRTYKVEQLTSSDVKLSETEHTWKIGAIDYSWAPLSGLWRTFRYEGATENRIYEGTDTPSVKRVEYYYNATPTDCSWTTALNTYGNLGCIIEKDRGTVVRKTIHAYGVNTAAHIVDRNIATSILNSAGQYIAHSQRFYDNHNQALGVIGARGNLTREIKIANMPLGSNITNVQLNGRDLTYGYDAWGNPTEVRTYPSSGWVTFTGDRLVGEYSRERLDFKFTRKRKHGTGDDNNV